MQEYISFLLFKQQKRYIDCVISWCFEHPFCEIMKGYLISKSFQKDEQTTRRLSETEMGLIVDKIVTKL